MKGKIITILVSLLVILVLLTSNSIASGDNSSNTNGYDGPAPNSGDGVPDGPGW